MTRFLSRVARLAVVACGMTSVGCQVPGSPGGLLPNFAAAMHDREIATHAATSGFPSPADVGLADDDSAP